MNGCSQTLTIRHSVDAPSRMFPPRGLAEALLLPLLKSARWMYASEHVALSARPRTRRDRLPALIEPRRPTRIVYISRSAGTERGSRFTIRSSWRRTPYAWEDPVTSPIRGIQTADLAAAIRRFNDRAVPRDGSRRRARNERQEHSATWCQKREREACSPVYTEQTCPCQSHK